MGDIDPRGAGRGVTLTVVEVRQAADADIDQIIELQNERNGPECGDQIRALVDDPDNGVGCFTVAAQGGRVVSSLCLIREHLTMEGVSFGVGQPEFVATHPDYGHQGLVRAQMELVHGWSAARGDLAQMIAGIPYFYRRFGYEYAIRFPRLRLVSPEVTLEMPDGWSVRHATVDDVDAIMRLEASAQAQARLVASRSARWWRWYIRNEDPLRSNVVAIRDGQVHGSAYVGPGPPGIGESTECVHCVAVDEADAVWALLAHANKRGQGKPVGIDERAGFAHVAFGASQRHRSAYDRYVRVPDPVALLDHLRPVLCGRLARSHYAGSSGSLLVSFYKHSLTITYKDGEVISIERAGPDQDPSRQGGIGVPPDLMATFIFGRFGAAELEDRYPDVRLGRAADLAEALFPRLEADIVTSL
jgi:predicted N-acetyltransferase YhbS